MKLLAALALIPIAIGPLPHDDRAADRLVATLCNGGTITIPLGETRDEKPARDCQHQACHAGTCRERSDRGRGNPRARRT